MKKLTIKIQRIAEEQGLYVTECGTNLDPRKNYMIGMHDRCGSAFFKSYKEVELFLDIK